MPRPRATAITALALALTTGCSTTTAPMPSQTAPTSTATPSATSPSTPSAELYAEAERVLREYVAEDDKIMQSGGVVTKKLYALTGAPALADDLKRYLSMRKHGVSSRGAQKIVYIHPAPAEQRGKSELALKACIERSAVEYFYNKQQLGTEEKLLAINYFALIGGTLKFVDQRAWMGADAC